MKRITQTLVILTFAGATTAVMAASTPYPTSANETTSLSSEFPDLQTYRNSHGDNRHAAPQPGFPSTAVQETPLSSEFPDMRTYSDMHVNDAIAQAPASPFPLSAVEEPSMADEGLIPGIAGISPLDNRGATN